MESLTDLQFFDILFYFFAAITVLSAAVVVFSKNIVYAAFALLFTFFGVAGIYVLLNSDFLAVTQLLVYVGGILVLVLFGVMLTNRSLSLDVTAGSVKLIPSAIIGSILLGALGGFLWVSDWYMGARTTDVTKITTSVDIGHALISTHAILFEVASVILLVALIGAVLIARKDK